MKKTISDHGRFLKNGRFWMLVGEQKIDKKIKNERRKNSKNKKEEEVEYDQGTVPQYHDHIYRQQVWDYSNHS